MDPMSSNSLSLVDTPRSIGVMQISVHGSVSDAKKDLGLSLNRFLRHLVEEAFNEFVSVETAKGESFDTNLFGLMPNKDEKSTSSNV